MFDDYEIISIEVINRTRYNQGDRVVALLNQVDNPDDDVEPEFDMDILTSGSNKVR